MFNPSKMSKRRPVREKFIVAPRYKYSKILQSKKPQTQEEAVLQEPLQKKPLLQQGPFLQEFLKFLGTTSPQTSPPVNVTPPKTSPPVTATPPKTSPPRTSSSKTSPPRTTPPKTSPPRTTPPKTSPPRTTLPKTSPPRTTPTKTSPPRTTPPKTSPPRTTSSKTSPPRTTSPKTNPSRTSSSRIISLGFTPSTANPPRTSSPETNPSGTSSTEANPPEITSPKPNPAVTSSEAVLNHPQHDQSSSPMTFYPTVEELASFDTYVAYMESQGAHKAGIARIVTPKDWTARKAGYEPSEVEIIIDNPVKQNIAITLVPGAFTTIGDRSIPPFTLPEYLRLATSPKYLTPSHSSYEELEQLYWQQNSDASLPSPIYGADVQASLTDPDQTVFNLTKLPSVLSGMSEQIPGVNLPYLYIGMWKATFSWHIEDMDLYAVNFLHYGAPKTWYCVPPQYGYKLEQLAQKLFPDMADSCFNLLRHKAVMIGPDLLRANGIPVNKLVHEQGTIMVVFPHAYHSGFNHGFNMAESLNFALPRWVDYGKRHRGCLCRNLNRAVRVNMDQFVQKFQPELFDKWRKGEDFALHPEDPEFMKLYLEDLVMRVELGFIKQSQFEILIKDLTLKREIAPWFKKKFPLSYTDVLETVIQDDATKEISVDENGNKIPELFASVKDLQRPLPDCYVMIKPLEEDVFGKHLDEMKAYEAFRVEQILETELKKAVSKVGSSASGYGFKGVNKEDLKAKKSQMFCSANRRHNFKACTKCSGCREVNCEACVFCLDKVKNGGRFVLKQKCVKRVCENPVVATCGSCKWHI